MTDQNLSIEQRMTHKLTQALSPERLEVINESHLHAGHQEAFDGTGETHFRVRIVSLTVITRAAPATASPRARRANSRRSCEVPSKWRPRMSWIVDVRGTES